MSQGWPHAPSHRLTEAGIYMITAGTYRKAMLFDNAAKLNMLQKAMFIIAAKYGWHLEAWSLFANHYHFVAHAPSHPESLVEFLRELHSRTAHALNRVDAMPGRKIWHNYWETLLTSERAYFARLHYVHQNPVKHGAATSAAQYPWCSARCFETLASPARVQTIYSFPIDRVKIEDDY